MECARTINIQHIGKGTIIDDSVILPLNYWIGDRVFIGKGVRILGGPFFVGDYSKIHAGTFIYTQPDVFPDGYVAFGHNTWIGQNSIIDGSGGFRAGDNLGIGMSSQLYTHISNGDLLEGCNFHGIKPMRLGDDVWFVGFCLAGPVVAGNKCIALLGSNVTRDMESNHVYGGNPAVDVISKVGPAYRKISDSKKIVILNDLKNEFFKSAAGKGLDSKRIFIVSSRDTICREHKWQTIFDVATRTYTKRGTEAEIRFMAWLTRFRAKFTPKDEPSSTLMNSFLSDKAHD